VTVRDHPPRCAVKVGELRLIVFADPARGELVGKETELLDKAVARVEDS
jgi:hypothetical protein